MERGCGISKKGEWTGGKKSIKNHVRLRGDHRGSLGRGGGAAKWYVRIGEAWGGQTSHIETVKIRHC